MMRALQLAAFRAFDDVHGRQRVMRPAHAAARFRFFVLLDSHDAIAREKSGKPLEMDKDAQRGASSATVIRRPRGISKTRLRRQARRRYVFSVANFAKGETTSGAGSA